MDRHRPAALHKIGHLNGPLTFRGHYPLMIDLFSALVSLFLKSAAVLLIANEVRGLVLAGPVFYAMYQSGGTLIALWLGFCSLGGIALSVVVPLVVAKKLRLVTTSRTAAAAA